MERPFASVETRQSNGPMLRGLRPPEAWKRSRTLRAGAEFAGFGEDFDQAMVGLRLAGSP